MKINNSINNPSQSRPTFGMRFSEETIKLAQDAGEETLKIFNKLAEDTKTHDLFVDIEPPEVVNKFKRFIAGISTFDSSIRTRVSWHINYKIIPSVLPGNGCVSWGMDLGDSFDSVIKKIDEPKIAKRFKDSVCKILKSFPEEELGEGQLEFIKQVQKSHLDERHDFAK